MSASQVASRSDHDDGVSNEPADTCDAKLSNLFDVLDANERELFLSRCSRHQFRVGEDLYAQGDPYTKSYLIRAGKVRTYYVAASGKEITLAHWSEGTLLGGPNVFRERRPHIWSAQAVTDVVVEQIKGRDLEELCLHIPRLAHYLIEALVWKLHVVSVLLQSFGTQSVRARVAHLLLQLSEQYGVHQAEGITIGQRFSHDELGQMVGATRVWVTLALKELKKEGLITTRGRDIVILNMKKLREKEMA